MDIKQKLVRLKNVKFIRIILYPAVYLYEFILYKKYQKSDDSRYIKSLHNKHLGQRCFIIGNGPSLKTDDLEKIKNEISFASNRIYHIFEHTNWRPNYYISIDLNALISEFNKIKNCGNFPKFINYKIAGLCDKEKKKSDNLWYIYMQGKFNIDIYKRMSNKLSDNISKHFTKLHTVTASAIEMAVYMGFNEIYLLGVDNNYAKKIDKDGKIYDDPSVKSSYFDGMKKITGVKGEENSVQNVDAMNYSYELCKKFADEKGIKICNATRGGKLEVFERVDFDSLFSNNTKGNDYAEKKLDEDT